MFCNRNCLNEARKFHEAECAIMGFLYETSPINEITGCFTRIWQALKITGSVEQFQVLFQDRPEKKKTIFDLDLLSQDKHSRDMMYLKLISLSKSNSYLTYGEEFIDYLKMFLKNMNLKLDDFVNGITRFVSTDINFAFSVSTVISKTKTPDEEASAILPFGFLFNHSCDPNIEVVFLEKKFVFIVRKRICQGDQLFISYG